MVAHRWELGGPPTRCSAAGPFPPPGDGLVAAVVVPCADAGNLVLCATPIGNLGDTSPRLLEVLAGADVVYAEDTRRAARLFRHLDIDRSARSYFVGNEAGRAGQLRDELANGMTVALLTDAGTPSVSDPGLSAVEAALEAGATVTTVAGPSAVTAALTVSGLPADRFVFEGFLPRSGGGRTTVLEALAIEQRTSVIFSSPRRLGADLADLAAKLGGRRRVVVVRELTKLHEEVWRGSLEEAASTGPTGPEARSPWWSRAAPSRFPTSMVPSRRSGGWWPAVSVDRRLFAGWPHPTKFPDGSSTRWRTGARRTRPASRPGGRCSCG